MGSRPRPAVQDFQNLIGQRTNRPLMVRYLGTLWSDIKSWEVGRIPAPSYFYLSYYLKYNPLSILKLHIFTNKIE